MFLDWLGSGEKSPGTAGKFPGSDGRDVEKPLLSDAISAEIVDFLHPDMINYLKKILMKGRNFHVRTFQVA